MYVAEIVGVSESEFDAILSEKSPPNGKRGTSGVYYSAFGESAEGVLVVPTKEQVLYTRRVL